MGHSFPTCISQYCLIAMSYNSCRICCFPFHSLFKWVYLSLSLSLFLSVESAILFSPVSVCCSFHSAVYILYPASVTDVAISPIYHSLVVVTVCVTAAPFVFYITARMFFDKNPSPQLLGLKSIRYNLLWKPIYVLLYTFLHYFTIVKTSQNCFSHIMKMSFRT